MILAEATCTYRSPATLDEHLDVWIKATWLKRSSFAFEYRIAERSSGRLVATGHTVQVMYDYAAGRSMPIPPALRARFEEFEGRPLGADGGGAPRRRGAGVGCARRLIFQNEQ